MKVRETERDGEEIEGRISDERDFVLTKLFPSLILSHPLLAVCAPSPLLLSYQGPANEQRVWRPSVSQRRGQP